MKLLGWAVAPPLVVFLVVCLFLSRCELACESDCGYLLTHKVAVLVVLYSAGRADTARDWCLIGAPHLIQSACVRDVLARAGKIVALLCAVFRLLLTIGVGISGRVGGGGEGVLPAGVR